MAHSFIYFLTTFDLPFVPHQISDGGELRGSQAVAHLREHERQHGVRPAAVVACTGNAAYCFEDLRRAGVDRVWGKPFPRFDDGTLQRDVCELLAETRSYTSVSSRV